MNLNRKKHFLCFPCVLACLVYSDKVSAQFYSVRTNLVGLGTGNLNVEGSMAFSTHWSAHLPVQYNPFRLWDDGKLKNFTVQPGVRYWMRETYGRGCFIGLHGVFSIYNAGGLSRRWNLEFELGLGVVWADWERYRCVNCGKRTGKGSGVYVTPTRTAVNLVYLF